MEWLAMCLVLMSGISDAADKEATYSVITEVHASALIEDYNNVLKESYGSDVPAIKKGMTAVGMIITKEEILNGVASTIIKARIEHNAPTLPEYVTFKIVLDDPYELPIMIERARIVYIGNQLIIDDLNTNEAINFFVVSRKTHNKTPHIKTMATKMISVKKGNSVEINI